MATKTIDDKIDASKITDPIKFCEHHLSRVKPKIFHLFKRNCKEPKGGFSEALFDGSNLVVDIHSEHNYNDVILRVGYQLPTQEIPLLTITYNNLINSPPSEEIDPMYENKPGYNVSYYGGSETRCFGNSKKGAFDYALENLADAKAEADLER